MKRITIADAVAALKFANRTRFEVHESLHVIQAKIDTIVNQYEEACQARSELPRYLAERQGDALPRTVLASISAEAVILEAEVKFTDQVAEVAAWMHDALQGQYTAAFPPLPPPPATTNPAGPAHPVVTTAPVPVPAGTMTPGGPALAKPTGAPTAIPAAQDAEPAPVLDLASRRAVPAPAPAPAPTSDEVSLISGPDPASAPATARKPKGA